MRVSFLASAIWMLVMLGLPPLTPASERARIAALSPGAGMEGLWDARAAPPDAAADGLVSIEMRRGGALLTFTELRLDPAGRPIGARTWPARDPIVGAGGRSVSWRDDATRNLVRVRGPDRLVWEQFPAPAGGGRVLTLERRA
jgi:hypothetical protein